LFFATYARERLDVAPSKGRVHRLVCGKGVGG
jgi:hypothetical protein